MQTGEQRAKLREEFTQAQAKFIAGCLVVMVSGTICAVIVISFIAIAWRFAA